jgi:glutathione S-transferase
VKLISLNASPFARKVRILMIELGLENSVVIQNPGAVTPASNNEILNKVNPLGLVPALELENGDSVYDSLVICDYLNNFAKGSLFPSNPEQRIQALGLHSLANSMLDLAVSLRYETALRPEELRWQTWIDHQIEKLERGLDSLEGRCSGFNASPLIGEISVACILGYMDFRYTDNDWRQSRPALASWFEEVMKRDSLSQTIPE